MPLVENLAKLALSYIASARKLSLWAVWIAAITAIMISLIPALEGPSPVQYEDIRKEVAGELEKQRDFGGPPVTRSKVIPVTWMAFYEVAVNGQLFCYAPTGGPEPVPQSTVRICNPNISPVIETKARWEFVVLILSGALFLTIVTVYGSSTGVASPAGPRTIEGISAPISDGPRSPTDITELAKRPAYREMRLDVNLAMQRADSLFARSNLMLFAGIIVAFLGVLLFAILTSLASEPAVARPFVPEPEDFWRIIVNSAIANFRPTAIFIFLETISWYLLRQYRALIEDYKAFYRIYLRRQNVLAAYIIAHNRPLEQSAELVVVASLLQEDLSGHISKDRRHESEDQFKFASETRSSLMDFILGLAKTTSSAKAGQAATGS